MLLVLAVAAAVCMQIFVQAHLTAQQNHFQDAALQAVQNTGEILKSTGSLEKTAALSGGSYENGIMTVENRDFIIAARSVPDDDPLLATAQITATRGDTVLIQLHVCWQEVAP